MTGDWLRPVLEALESAEATTLFFRDDDAGWADDRLFELLDVFAATGMPVDLAVIPEATGLTLADALIRRSRVDRIGLHQHGWSHTNHEPVGRKAEFGTARPAAARLDDIRRGQMRLADLFGDLPGPHFTPPWNRCAPDTGVLLAECGFRVLSRNASARPVPPADPARGFVELPVSFDWSRQWRNGGRRSIAESLASDIVDAGRRGAIGGRPVGVMLHHAAMDGEQLDALDQLLKLAGRHSAVRVEQMAILAGTAARGVLVPTSNCHHRLSGPCWYP